MVVTNYVLCARCRRWRPLAARLVCRSCYQMGHGDPFGSEHHMTNRETLEDLERLIESQRDTMEPEARLFGGRPLPVEKPARTAGGIRADYPQSPHGENCPLLKLVMRGEGGFSRGLMEADKYLRDHPSWSMPLKARQSPDGEQVWVTFANGETMEFPRKPAKADSRTRRDAARACRLAIFAILERRGPLTAVQIAAALSREPEYIRVAMAGSDGWFVRTALTKGSTYTITPKGAKEYATLNHGKPLVRSKSNRKVRAKV